MEPKTLEHIIRESTGFALFRLPKFARKVLLGDFVRDRREKVRDKVRICADDAEGPFDCIVADALQDRGYRIIKSLRALNEWGCALIITASPNYVLGPPLAPDAPALPGLSEVVTLLMRAGLVSYDVWPVWDVELRALPQDADGYAEFKGQRYRLGFAREYGETTAMAFVVVGTRPGYDPLKHAAHLREAGDTDSAYEVLGRIPRTRKDSAETVAAIALEQLRCSDAIEEKSPQDPADVEARGWRFFKAELHAFEALSYGSFNPEPGDRLAEWWRRIGDAGMAARYLRSIHAAAPDPARALRVRELEALAQASPAVSAFPHYPKWDASAGFRPRILFITHDRPNYGLDLLFDGLCRTLGAENVTEFPWKPTLHGSVARDMMNYPCLFNHPGRNLSLEDAVGGLERGDYDYLVWGDYEAHLPPEWAQRLVKAAGPDRLILLDQQDDPVPKVMAMQVYLDMEQPFLCFKREMLACLDYGPRTFPLPFSYSADRVPPAVDGARDTSLFWAGHRTAGLRRVYLEMLERRFNISLDTQYTPEVYASALLRSQIGLCIFGTGFDTVRYWELPAHGCMMLAERMPIVIPDDFEDGVSAVLFNDAEDLTGKMEYYLEHPDEAATIARAGRLHLLKHHTSVARAQQMLAWIHKAESARRETTNL